MDAVCSLMDSVFGVCFCEDDPAIMVFSEEAEDYLDEASGFGCNKIDGKTGSESITLLDYLKHDILERYYDVDRNVWKVSSQTVYEKVPWNSETDRIVESDFGPLKCVDNYKEIRSCIIKIDEGSLSGEHATANKVVHMLDKMMVMANKNPDGVWKVDRK